MIDRFFSRFVDYDVIVEEFVTVLLA
jgi:hypothetical protein